MKTRCAFFQWLWLFCLPAIGLGQVGTTAPDFTGTDTHGQTHTLYEYLEAGKVVVLDFFYTTCTPCQFYSPQVNLAYEKYGCNNANVVFLSIDYNDTNAEVNAYEEEYHIPFPSIGGLSGGGNAIVNAYQIIGFPTFYVIDSTKKIIDQIDPPTLQVFDFRFHQHGIEPADCTTSAVMPEDNLLRPEVFPNPVGEAEVLNVRLPSMNTDKVQYEILSALGQSVDRGQYILNDSQSMELKIKHLDAGMYIVKIHLLNNHSVYSGMFFKE